MFEVTVTAEAARWTPPHPEDPPSWLDVATASAEDWALQRGLTGPAAASLSVADAVACLGGVDLARYLLDLPDRAGVDGWTVIEAIRGWEKVARHAQAQQLAWIAELGDRRPAAGSKWAHGQDPDTDLSGAALPAPGAQDVGDHARACATELGLALDLPRGTAQGLLLDAFRLQHTLPEALHAVADGLISVRSARALATETGVLDDTTARSVTGWVLDWARTGSAGKTTAQLVVKTRRAVVAADADAAKSRETQAVSHRQVSVRKQVEDGMITWYATLPAAASVLAWERIVALADAARHDGDERTANARRADVFLDLLLAPCPTTFTAAGTSPTTHPDDSPAAGHAGHIAEGTAGHAGHTSQRTRVWRTDVVVAASTLLGHDDQPGELVGWGPITARTARTLAGVPDGSPSGTAPPDNTTDASGVRFTAVWRRLLTDPATGTVRDYGTTRYRPPSSLADLIRARDGRCIQPGCRTSAWRADVDHIRNSPAGPSPHPDPGGATADWNLGAACRTDHRIKTMPGWDLTSPTPGTFLWTTPTGHTYQRHPEPPLGNPTALPLIPTDAELDAEEPPPF